MEFARFQQYCSRTMDEMPLYLFDKHAFDKAPQLADDFKVCASVKAAIGRCWHSNCFCCCWPCLVAPSLTGQNALQLSNRA